ncbi:hypothetical protein Tco_0320309 [Tanacetum coccineum]
MSSPNRSTSDIEDAFSSMKIITILSHRVTSQLHEHSFNSSENSNIIPSVISPLNNNPYLKNVQAFYAKELPIPSPDPITSPAILTSSPMPPKRTSTSETPAITLAAIWQLINDGISSALKAQAASMSSASNLNKNTGISGTPVFQENGRRGRPELEEVYLFYIHRRVARKCISAGVGCDQQLPLRHPNACQDVVDHIAPPKFFLELRHLPNDEFMNQYNINLTRQVAMGSQLRLRFEQEAKLLKKSVAQVARRDQKIEAKEKQIQNLEALLEVEADMKKAAEAKNAELVKELESLCSQFLDLQLSNQQLSQQVSTLQAQITSEEKIKAAFEEFKKYEDDRVEQRCAKMDACLDKLSVDFDEELYPHMLTAIAGHRWVIGHGLRLAVMKCGETPELRQAFENVVSARLVKGMSEGLEHGIKHGKDGRYLEAVEAYDPEAHSKYLKALQELKDLKYPLVDQLEGLKDAPMELIMASSIYNLLSSCLSLLWAIIT